MNTSLHTTSLLTHLRSAPAPFSVRRGVVRGESAHMRLQMDDVEAHAERFARDPELYALLSLANGVSDEQRLRVLFRLLAASRAGVVDDVREVLDSVGQIHARTLPTDRVLTVFLALRAVRANHKHTTRAILQSLFDHPAAEDLFVRRRGAVRDIFEHAVGRDVARGCARMLREAKVEGGYIHRHVLRFVTDEARASLLVRSLYEPEVTLPTQDLDYKIAHSDLVVAAPVERAKAVTTTNRGDVAAALVHLYRGGRAEALELGLERALEAATSELPVFEGSVTVVLDASSSMRGYGDREFAHASQAKALELVIGRTATDTRTVVVGGEGEFNAPTGSTDLASAVIAGLDDDPDLLVVLTDGYENDRPGDLARLIEALPAAGVRTPVFVCTSMFSWNDDLTLRRPAPEASTLSFWHQDDFAQLLFDLYSQAVSGRAFACAVLEDRMSALLATARSEDGS